MKNKLAYVNFPVYMIKKIGNSVEGIEQIDLTEEKYKLLKEDKLKELALNAAKNAVQAYGYEVTTTEINIKEQ